jgi:integrase
MARFTDKTIDALKPQDRITDKRETDGFGIRVLPSGVKTWFYIYRFEGKRRFMNLGHYPAITLSEARTMHRSALSQVEKGLDPLAAAEELKQERKRTPMLSDLIDEYIRIYAKPKLKSWEKIEKSLKRVFVPVLGKKKITDINRRDVKAILNEVALRAPVMANRLHAYIVAMFAWAEDQGELEINSLAGMKRPGGTEDPRQRKLSDEEIKTLWKALDAPDLNMTDEIKRAIKLVLVTAQRPGEVIGMHTEEIDGHWWTIPASRAKNGLAHRVYLTQTALSLLGGTSGKGYIFKTAGKEDLPMTELAMNTAIRRHLLWPLKDAKGNPLYNKDGKPATENRLGVDHLTPHDLRRTAATGISNLDFVDEHVDALLNHKKAGIKRVYILNKYDKEKQMMLEAWERKLTSIITGKESKVISINAGKKAA